jgi:hypothetical protein
MWPRRHRERAGAKSSHDGQALISSAFPYSPMAESSTRDEADVDESEEGAAVGARKTRVSTSDDEEEDSASHCEAPERYAGKVLYKVQRYLVNGACEVCTAMQNCPEDPIPRTRVPERLLVE